MGDLGNTYLCTIWSANGHEALETLDKLKDIVDITIKKHTLDVKKTDGHQFEPKGASLYYILGSSHLVVHTWPEVNKATLDLHQCSKDNIAVSKKVAHDIAKSIGGRITKEATITH